MMIAAATLWKHLTVLVSLQFPLFPSDPTQEFDPTAVDGTANQLGATGQPRQVRRIPVEALLFPRMGGIRSFVRASRRRNLQ